MACLGQCRAEAVEERKGLAEHREDVKVQMLPGNEWRQGQTGEILNRNMSGPQQWDSSST